MNGKIKLNPDSIVKSCDYVEMASCYALDGIRTCVHGTINGPLLATSEEINRNVVNYDMIIRRRREIFEIVNGYAEGDKLPCMGCANLKEKLYKDVDFSFLGGKRLPAGMNIQHYSACNQRCKYCSFTVNDNWLKSQYDPIKYFEIFKNVGKLRGDNWIDFSGGETSLLKDFDRILGYLLDNDLGPVVVYSNATVYKQSIYDALKENKIILTTSLDTGLPSTYKRMRASRDFDRVIANLIKYKESGTNNLWLKYVITNDNMNEDDLWSFVFAMRALKPARVMICPDFPYGKSELPIDVVRFAARLWCLLEKLVGVRIVDYTKDFGDAVWVKYHQQLPIFISEEAEKIEAMGFD